MKYNAYDIVSSILREDVSSVFSDPIELTSNVADKVIDATSDRPERKLGKWTIHNTAKAIKHLLNKKKESDNEIKNKIKGD